MLSSCLIGNSGFIGSNLAHQHSFSNLYRSTNIAEIDGKKFDLLVCAGVSAAKWKANQAPEEDRKAIDGLLHLLGKVEAKQVILISTVDVYPVTRGVDESFDCSSQPNHAYGTNRLYVEKAFRELFPATTIVRLPGVFGRGLKKNVIYDLLHDNCLDMIQPASSFQYYNVGNLWGDLQVIQDHQIPLINLSTEPIPTQRILQSFFPDKVVGEKAGPPGSYDIRSMHAEVFGGHDGYLWDAEQVLAELGDYVAQVRNGVSA